MRGGKVVVALAVVLGTAAMWLTGNAPVNASTQESGWQFEDPEPAAAPATATNSEPVNADGFTWSAEPPKPAAARAMPLQRTQSRARRSGESNRPVREPVPARQGSGAVEHAALTGAGRSTVTPVGLQQTDAAPKKRNLPDFGDLTEDDFEAPASATVAPPKSVVPSDADLFETGTDSDESLFAPLKPAEPSLPKATEPRPVQPEPTAAPAVAPTVRAATLPSDAVSATARALSSQPVSTMLDTDESSRGETIGGPFVTVTLTGQDTLTVGRECKCRLTVRNNGSSIAGNVIVEAYAPRNVRVAGADPQTAEPGSLTWTLGEIDPGEEKVIQVALVPTTSGPMNVKSFVRYSGQTSASFEVVQPMLKVALAGPRQAQIGEAAPYVISVTNPGTGVARNVVISARIPKGLEHRRGSQLNMQIGSLNPGESRTVRLALTAMEPGDQPIRIAANADGDLTDKAAATVAVVAPMLNLEIKGPPIRHAGRRGKYAIRVSNPGNIATSNVRAKYRVPAGFEFLEADRGGRVAADGTIEWFVGQLAPGESSEFSVSLRARQLGSFTHQAGVVSEHGATKSAQMATRVEGVASLAITILDRDDPVEVGQETLYEVRVSNEGSKDARNVVLTCELPAGMKVTSVRGPVNYFKRDGKLVFEPLDALAVGKTGVYQVVVTATSGGSQRLRARLTSDSVKEPLISEELTKVYAD